jgi:hypothetical protein
MIWSGDTTLDAAEPDHENTPTAGLDIMGSAFVFSDDESDRFTTIPSDTAQQIADRIADVSGS